MPKMLAAGQYTTLCEKDTHGFSKRYDVTADFFVFSRGERQSKTTIFPVLFDSAALFLRGP